MTAVGRKRSLRWQRWLAGLVGAVLAATPVANTSAAAAPARDQRLKPQVDASVPGSNVPGGSARAATGTGKPFTAAAPVWPSAAVADVALPAPGTAAATGAVRIGGLPVRLARAAATSPVRPADADPVEVAPDRVRVEVLDRQATRDLGVAGVALRLTPTTGRVRLEVGYGAFRYAYGGDWAARLHLVALPDMTVLPTRNDLATATATADVDTASTTVVALTATSSGSTGSFGATTLSPSSTWQAGGSSGAFSWSYGMDVPPGLDGPEPQLALAYSSAGVDGRMVSSNNQPSWVGEGFDFTPGGFIERKYRACSKDGGNGSTAGTGSGDLCWKTDNATLSLNGKSLELIRASDGTWHGRTEDGSRIVRATNSAYANGDNDNEYWVVTESDGTQYWFGRNRLPGWVSGAAETNSTWTVPVYGNQSGEPCAVGWCMQAWRWNLDYVVDPFGSTMSFWYAKETNQYARNSSTASMTTYTRAGYLTRIDYGTRSSTAYGTAPMQVVFNPADRCLSSCTTHDATHWPDTPWDQSCSSSSCLVNTPTFWTTKRLASVTTQVRSGTAYRAVEWWTFTHSFPDPGDGTRAGLWLARISHSGLASGTTTLPDVTFLGVQMPNRVDAKDWAPPMNWWRIATITTESGDVIGVTYSPQDCVAGTRMPSAPESNTLRCYPVRWTPEGYSSPITDYFHKYVVTQVTESDQALPSDGRSVRAITTYDYSKGTPAWHYTDDDGLLENNDKTWSDWRGYDRVVTTAGDPGEQSSTETLYYRGMNGDRLPGGATRSVSVQASEGAAVPDEDVFAGMAREQIVYNGSAVESGTISDPWRSAPTATRTLTLTVAGTPNVNVTVEARYVHVGSEHERVALDGGRGWRRTTTNTTFDGYGMKVAEEDLGDDARTDDQQCTLTTYVRNTSAWLMSYPSRVRRYGVDCTAAAGTLTEADAISDEYTSYDGQARGAAPTQGAATRTEELITWPSTYVTTSRSSYDSYGREVQSWDERDNLTTTDFTPSTGGPVTAVTSKNHLGSVVNAAAWVTTTTVDPAWGSTTAQVDPNGKRTDVTYDGLGRVTAVWYANRSKAAGDSASATYGYQVRNTAPTVVTSSVLNAAGGYTTGYTFYDGLLRERQTQAPDVPASGAAQGRVITDTFYDSAGRQARTNHEYVADGAPSATDLFLPAAGAVIPAQTATTFDGVGRPVASVFLVNGTEKWRTTTGYGGDRTDVTPPAGSPPTSSYVDANGKQTALRQYAGSTPTGSYTESTYTYNRKGQLTGVTDAAGNRWTYGYDLLGRQNTRTDPDQGTATSTYYDSGDLKTTTDARGEVLAYTYDTLGRKTSMRDDSVTGTKRAEWSYDTTASGGSAKGQLVKSTRWVGTDAYTDEITGFSSTYQPTARTITIPASTATTGVSGSYSYVYSYKPDGSPATVRLPGVGGLPTETLTYGYQTNGRLDTLSTNVSSTGNTVYYVNGTSYTRYGELGVIGRRYDTGPFLDTGAYYEVGTRRLNRLLTTRETPPSLVADDNYTQDAAGNVTKITDAASSDTQCFGYDYLRRLTEAWTPSSGDCATARSQSSLGGPAPYWQSFGYDGVGNRTTSTDRTATTSTTRTYAYPPATTSQPHALTSTSVGGTTTGTYTYDPTGNTRTRPGAAGTQTLTWDAEGELASSADGTGTTGYTYTADGDRLIRTDPTGTTLYLPDQELRYTGSTGAKAGVRYYTHAAQTIGERDAGGVTWLVDDAQGTAQSAVAQAGQAVTTRRQMPFGESRGTGVTWPNDKGFVGGTNDNTGLVHLGAREYDAGIGRFVSVDPLFDKADPQSWNGYGYADNTPATASDPDGQCIRLEDMSGPCAGAVKTKAGKRALRRYENWQRRHDRYVARYHVLEHRRARALLRRTGEDRMVAKRHVYHRRSAEKRANAGPKRANTTRNAPKSGCSITHWCFHAPDYVTLDIASFDPEIFVGGGAQITVTRDGHVYGGSQVGAGGGDSGYARAGWIGGPWGSGVSDHHDIDDFVKQASVTLSEGVNPLGFAETWGSFLHLGNNAFATEAGGGFGSGVGITGTWSFHLFDIPWGW